MANDKPPADADLGPGWADRVVWPEPEGGGKPRRRRPLIKAKRASDHAAMVRRAAARTKAERQLERALDAALPYTEGDE